jgi:hypothetical protein
VIHVNSLETPENPTFFEVAWSYRFGASVDFTYARNGIRPNCGRVRHLLALRQWQNSRKCASPRGWRKKYGSPDRL